MDSVMVSLARGWASSERASTLLEDEPAGPSRLHADLVQDIRQPRAVPAAAAGHS